MKHLRKIVLVLFVSLCLTAAISGCSDIDLREVFVQKRETQTRFLLNTEYITMMKEDTFVLSVSAQDADDAPAFTTVWLTDNADIVTVNDGVLYAVSQGVTNVRARITVQDTTPYVKDLVCTVEVAINRVPVTGISLRKTSLELTEGEADTLYAVFEPAQTTETEVVWSSSDPTVVSVGADGTLLANKPGIATVTAVSAVDSSLTAACKVTVKESKTSQVKSITLDASSLRMNIGDKNTLSAVVSASSFKGSVKWQSDNTEIASVSQTGVVTAVAKGTTYITATAGDKSASCRVTVSGGTGSVIPCTEVYLNETDLRIIDGSTTVKLEAVCLPLNTTEIGVWSSSNTDVATVTTGGVVSVKNLSKIALPWKTTIRYTVSGSVSASCVITVIPKTILASSIYMSEAVYSLAPGDTVQVVTAKDIANSYDIWVWESSDPSIFTVSDTGEITGVSAGTATVTVYSQDRPTVKASALVSVNKIQVPVTLSTQSGLTDITTFDDILLQLSTDDPSLIPEDTTVALFSDNYRSVDFYVEPETGFGDTLTVYPTRSGTVILTPQLTTSSNRYEFVITPLTLTLTLPEPTELNLTETAISLFIGDEKQLEYALTPTECYGHFALQYSVSDTAVLAVSEDGKITALAAGETDITVTVADMPALTATCHVTVSEKPTESGGKEITESDGADKSESDGADKSESDGVEDKTEE